MYSQNRPLIFTLMYLFFALITTFTAIGKDLPTATAEILFQENFDDSAFSSRGWYDNTNLRLSTTEHIPGSISSVEYRFLKDAATPPSGGAIRKIFAETEQVYVSYYVKYSSNWTGSNRPYHPHEFYLLTNQNGNYNGLSFTRLTAYIEQNEGTPLLALQDSQNIDAARIGQNLVGITENRAVNGCNGASDSYGNGDCYPHGSLYYNERTWRANGVYFQDTPGKYYKNDWHHVEAYFKLNSIVGGKGTPDGEMRYWLDGELLISRSNVMFRTGQHPNMKFNQFVIAPYIGNGSPVDQTFWVDNLTVATERPMLNVEAPKNLRTVP